jgi:hypothetical protein
MPLFPGRFAYFAMLPLEPNPHCRSRRPGGFKFAIQQAGFSLTIGGCRA